MKKMCKLITIILAMALFVLTPGFAASTACLVKLAPLATEVQYTAPKQSASVFKTEEKSGYELDKWSKPSTTNDLVTEQITPETCAQFHEKYQNNSLSHDNTMLFDRSPYIILNKIQNKPISGAYTSSEFTLSSNSYYLISIDYYVLEQANKDANVKNIAFGTFQLNDKTITLLPQNKGWDTATFFVTTDKLANTTATAKLYFGSEKEKALGAIYFENFTIAAVSSSFFASKLADRNLSTSQYMDYTHKNDIKEEISFSNNNFTPATTTTNADSYNNILTSDVQRNLGFEDTFHSNDGTTKSVMMMKANKSNASLSLQSYTFEPKPYEVYMFQFYSITASKENTIDETSFESFYFLIGDTPIEIGTLSNYEHYNGWQLNTVFFIAGRELYQEYNLKFKLSNAESTTGWVCIDDFKIYKVNGTYAANNATAAGVHDTFDQNENGVTPDVANGYFDLGSTADTVNVTGSSYPYPLTAKSWTTNSTNNGIVNTAFWDDRFGLENPGRINNNYSEDNNNNIYMLHNSTSTQNILTSPLLSTTTGSTTYISFDAHSTGTTQTRAYILTADTDESGNLINKIILPNVIDINDGEWHHYEFAITENEFASSRNYYLEFEMNGIGYTYIDNVTTAQKNTPNSTSAIVDLNNTLAIDDAWQATNEFATYSCNATPTGVELEIHNQPKTVIKNTFAYNLTSDEYFEIVIKARGHNAYLGLSNYEGLLEVITDKIDTTANLEYKLYLQPKSDATTVNLQVTLGNANDTDEQSNLVSNGNIFIKSIKITKISEDQFNIAREGVNADSRTKILSFNENKDTETEDNINHEDGNFFGENWWYLIPSLITAIALLLGIIAFLFRKIKFDKHITKKTTSYARDMRLKNQQNKIVAQKAAKVDNITDEK